MQIHIASEGASQLWRTKQKALNLRQEGHWLVGSGHISPVDNNVSSTLCMLKDHLVRLLRPKGKTHRIIIHLQAEERVIGLTGGTGEECCDGNGDDSRPDDSGIGAMLGPLVALSPFSSPPFLSASFPPLFPRCTIRCRASRRERSSSEYILTLASGQHSAQTQSTPSACFHIS